MPDSFRTFFACDLPDDCRSLIFDIQRQIKQTTADIKWVAPKNCHITLKFIGNIPHDTLVNIPTIFDPIFSTTGSLEFSLKGLGAFPSAINPEIIWIGINDPKGMFAQWSHIINHQMASLGIKNELRPFIPHITIGRLRSKRSEESLSQIITLLQTPSLLFRINNITLFQSRLTNQQPEYTVLHRWALK